MALAVGLLIGPKTSARAASAIADGISPLTERERDVLAAADEMPTAPEIAAHLYLSVRHRSMRGSKSATRLLVRRPRAAARFEERRDVVPTLRP